MAAEHALDLRSFVQALEDAGCLTRVREPVDWKFEIGARSRSTPGPLLFENVLDYPGQSVFTNGLSDARCIALALGFDAGVSQATLVKEAKKQLAAPPAPIERDAAPGLVHYAEGKEINLFSLPVPQWSPYETARYIGTWHLNVTRDPESQRLNVGVYRMQLLSPTKATVSASEGSDLTRHMLAAEKRGEALPMAMAIGVPEAVVMAAGAACPSAMTEYELAGALQGAPVELVRSTTSSLEVPASSEIVIEGFMHPGRRVQDGPYLDYCGRPNTNPQAFLFEATRLSWRDNPIFRGSAIGNPGAEDHQLFAFLAQLDLVDFHGSRKKQKVQNVLWKGRHFRALQWVGRLGSTLKNIS